LPKELTWQDVEECKQQSNMDAVKLRWERNQYMIKGEQLLYIDTLGNRIIVMRPGVLVPWNNTLKPVPYSVLNYPIDNHLATIVQDLTAGAIANKIELEAGSRTGEDEDKGAAKNSTHLLQYYFEKLKIEKKRRKIVSWLMPCGSCFAKVWWNTDAGDPQAYDEATGATLRGDPDCMVIASFDMLLPSSLVDAEDAEWIGHRQAMPVKKIEEIWGKKVPAEPNLRDVKRLGSDNSRGEADLKDHAMVYEIFYKPDKENPHGRHIVAANHIVLDAKPFDVALTAKFPERWNPYVMFEFITVTGDLWPMSVVDDLISLQLELNKITKQISEAKPNTKPLVIEGTGAIVDWNKVDLSPERGLPRIKVDGDASQLRVEWPRSYNQDLSMRKQDIIDRMNDRASSYPSTRGQPSSQVTSGDQAEVMMASSNKQQSPLLKNLAGGFTEIGQRILELCAVHFTDKGRLVKITGKDNQPIAFTFTPDQVRCENIVLSNGSAFYMLPEELRREQERLADKGYYGDMAADQVARARFFKQRDLPVPEGMFDSIVKHQSMQQWENRMFEAGKLEETDPYILSQIEQEMMDYQADMEVWNRMNAEFQMGKSAMEAGEVPPEMQMATPPPTDPGDPPEEPKPWRRARIYDNDDIHLEELNSWRESPTFEQLCAKNPQLREATDYHEQSHLKNKAAKMQQQSAMMAAVQPQM
jgi:hypothetical protein